MSSPGHWEVVSKNKKVKQNGQTATKLSKTEKKKFVENAPKVEDILPLAEVKSLYSDVDVIQEVPENKKPQKDVKSKEESKKPPKKQNEKKKDVKEKHPKSSQELDEGEFLAVMTEGQSRFADAPLVWLRDLTVFINSKLAPLHSASTVNQTSQALSSEWPSKLLPSKVRKAIQAALMKETNATRSAFFSTCLTALANDMSKGLPALGHRIMLQLLVNLQPSLAGENISKLISVRNSYQNRAPICLTILGTVGQAGYRDFDVGLRVWLEVMFPLVENRNYSRWVISYLGNLTTSFSEAKNTSKEDSNRGPDQIGVDLYFQVFDHVLPIGNSLTSQVQKELLPYLEPLRNIVLSPENEAVSSACFPLYLKRLQKSYPKALQTEVLEGLVQCLSHSPACFSVWCQFYLKHLSHSALLLRHINSTLTELDFSKKPFLETLKQFKSINSDILNKKKENAKLPSGVGSLEGLEECSRACDEILRKMSIKPSKKGFPYIKGSILCLLGIIGLIYYDWKKHGGVFRDSSVGHLLADIGALPTVEYAWMRGCYYYTEALNWAIINIPVYAQKSYETVKPFVLNGVEFVSYWISYAYAYTLETYPVVLAWIDEKAPGLREKCLEQSIVAWNGFKDFSFAAFKLSMEYLSLAVEWIKENVFVGHLSPENIQKLSFEAYNATHVYAVSTIAWIMEKVQ